jgi:hypothetical protein
MPRIRFSSLALVAILALAACQAVTDTGGVALSAESDAEADLLAVATPWKGWHDWSTVDVEWDDDGPGPGTSDFGGRCTTPSDYLIRGAGRGQMTHMGRVSVTSEHCGRYPDGTWDGGFMTFVAADGSALYTTYTGSSTPDFDAETYVFANDFAIVGGTGRFAGASGGGPGGALLAWEDEVPLFMGQFALPMWIDGRIIHAPGKALGR